MKLTQILKEKSIEKVYDYVDKDPDKNLIKILNVMRKLDTKNNFTGQMDMMERMINDPDDIWGNYIKDLFKDIDKNVAKTLLKNLVINEAFVGWPLQEELREKYNCNIPWAVLLDPTSACNLHCTGCWAAEYGNKLNLSFDEIDRIITEAKALGTYIFIYTGGEPLVRKADLMKLCRKHNDCVFLCFTNATLIDEAFANEMLEVGNFVPAISVEGFEEATDSRRGQGTFDHVVNAMNLLKSKKLPFGISCCYTRANVDVIGSEAYYDQMIKWGAKFVWFFTYMPVGVDSVKELMCTPEQRAHMYDVVRGFRSSKPIFAIDFFNDGEYVGGCIAGGRRYLHINANGDVDPCVFMHYSNINIHDHSLLECLQSPLFQAYHDNQPFNDNHLRPCPVLDNPGRLVDMVNKTGAKNTDLTASESAEDFTAKCEDTAKKWAPIADEIWANSPAGKAQRGAK